jgi:glycosyltransferase involved in cell wall biosynthesis
MGQWRVDGSKESQTMKKIAIVTDTAYPDVNGVATTLYQTTNELLTRGYDVKCISPNSFKSMKGVKTSDVRITLNPWKINKILNDYNPDALHVATEGTLGLFATSWAIKNQMSFTTAFHTDWSDWWRKNFGFGSWIVSWYLKQFHRRAHMVMCATPALIEQLQQMKCNSAMWSRGVDFDLFDKGQRTRTYPAPIWLYVGRVSNEKNIEDFLKLDLPGTKVVVGAGPQLSSLRKKYPEVRFEGEKRGLDLVNCYHSADVFVFPSEFDTFGLVMIEAIACGTPVAAKALPNTKFIIEQNITGVVDNNLQQACMAALKLDRRQVYYHRNKFSWQHATDQFLAALKFNK